MNPIMLILSVALVVFIFKMFQKIGVTDTKEERRDSRQAYKLEGIKEFDPKEAQRMTDKLVKQGKTKAEILKLSPNLTRMGTIARNIYDSKGFFKDDEIRALSFFNLLKNRYELALLSAYFSKEYKKDLVSYWKSFTNEEEQARLYRILKPLKTF